MKMEWYEKPLAMSVADICKEYREAKDKPKQIEVLAQLNDTHTTRIAWLLDRAGEQVPANKLPRAPRSENGADLDVVWGASAEAVEADEVRRRREEEPPPPEEKKPIPPKPEKRPPVEKKPVKKEAAERSKVPVVVSDSADAITAELWTAYLRHMHGRGIDEDGVSDLLAMRRIAERIGGIENAEMD